MPLGTTTDSLSNPVLRKVDPGLGSLTINGCLTSKQGKDHDVTQHMTNSEPLTPSTEMTSMSSNATVDRLLRDGAALLRAAGVDLPEAVAGSLLASLQDAACATAPTSDNLDAAAISSTMADEFYRLVDRCAGHEPMGYIVGHTWFRGLKLSVGPEVYAPKPETHATRLCHC